MPVDVTTPDDGAPSTIFVHVLQLDDPAEVRRRVSHLELLVVYAFGARQEVVACRADEDHTPLSRSAS
jgi:hypothetical protein